MVVAIQVITEDYRYWVTTRCSIPLKLSDPTCSERVSQKRFTESGNPHLDYLILMSSPGATHLSTLPR